MNKCKKGRAVRCINGIGKRKSRELEKNVKMWLSKLPTVTNEKFEVQSPSRATIFGLNFDIAYMRHLTKNLAFFS